MRLESSIVAAAAFVGALAACRPAAPPPVPASLASAPAAPAAPREPTLIADPPMVCVVQGGRIFTVEAQYRSATSDSVVNGRPLHEVYPVTAEHAATARWYHANEPVVFAGHRYIKYGLPRVLSPGDVVLAGNVQGVSAFAEPSAGRPPDVIYLPVDAGCMFQPYEVSEAGAAVRG